MQRGTIVRRHGAWHLRYRANGKQISQKLADYNDEHRTITSVRGLAEDILQPINKDRQTTGNETLQEFVETTYLPHARQHKEPSTVHGYEKIYNHYVASRVAGVRIRTYRTRDIQQLLASIASENDLTHRTLINVKNFLSGVFSHAKRMGSFDGVNPAQDTEVPKGRPSEETYAYSNTEVKNMRKVLKGTARVAVTVAAYTGLSLGELQGLKWTDIAGGQLTVSRKIWRGIEGPPKTETRKNSVPLLPVVKKELAEHRKSNPLTTWVFESPKARPYDLATFGSKIVKPQLDAGDTKWHGWHALRRGFATRLHDAGVQDKIIQSLMRHSSLSVTMKHYVKALPAANVEAIKKLNATK